MTRVTYRVSARRRCRVGAHRGCGNGGTVFPVHSEAAVLLVADGESIIEGQRDQGRRDMAGHAFVDDAEQRGVILDVICGHETI